MQPFNIRPVILCGGNGTRLWPVSRKSMPKQFTRLNGDRTLLQETILRLEDAGCGVPTFVANEEHRFIVGAQAEEVGLTEMEIIIEPESRNTAAAIYAAVENLASDDVDQLVLVAPADHKLDDAIAFEQALAVGAKSARDGNIVTFGVRPTRPDTGYGYIEIDPRFAAVNAAQVYTKFIEKPDQKQAEEMLEKGNFLWNAGIFLFSVSTLRAAMGRHASEIRAAVREALREASRDLDFLRLGKSFSKSPAMPFDKAVMEKIKGHVVPMEAGWADLGTWRGVWENGKKSDAGVVTNGGAYAIDCTDTLLHCSNEKIAMVGLGLKNIAAVATPDAVLVADLDSSQSVSQIVPVLKILGKSQAEAFQKCERPWGHYETLSLGNRFQVKSIVVKPGGELSLQSHLHRSEHWVVVEGTANVTIGSVERLVSENQSVYIPVGEVHRLANRGKVPLQLIEVQTGAYLGEDDIVRYEDVYQRA